MSGFYPLTTAEQVAAYLRMEVEAGRLSGLMPGVGRLEDELGVNRKTVDTALRQLEKEGLLVAQGVGRRRKIVSRENSIPPSLRVGLLLYEKDDRKLDYVAELVRQLQERGYRPFMSTSSLTGLRMNVKRVARFVERTPADAWVVFSGSREILQWFSEQPTPAFALHGRRASVSIAATALRKDLAMAATVRRLTELGHSRIVLLNRVERRKPEPGIVERAFLRELQAQGIETSDYNLPDWEETPEGFHEVLKGLFRVTPPTGLIVDGAQFYLATQQFLLHQGIRVPRDVSVVCCDPHPTFAWCHPTVSYIDYDNRIFVRNIMRWVNKVAHGKDDRRQVTSKAEFVEGGTIGPAKIG